MEKTVDVGAAVPQKKPQHLELDDAIEYLEQTADAIAGLIGEITDTPREDSVSPEKQQPSLSEMLSTGPARIMSQSDRIRDSLSQIRNLLF